MNRWFFSMWVLLFLAPGAWAQDAPVATPETPPAVVATPETPPEPAPVARIPSERPNDDDEEEDSEDESGAAPDVSDESAPAESEAPDVEVPEAPEGLSTTAGHLWQADFLASRGSLAAAEAKASLALSFDNKSAEARFQLAKIRVRQGKFPEALTFLNEAAEMDPKHGPSQILRVHLSGRGASVDAVLRELERASLAHPESLGLKLALGEAHLANEALSSAMSTARDVLKKAQTSVAAMHLLARAYFQGNRKGAAEAVLARARTVDGDDAMTLLWLGRISLDRGHLPKAVALFDEAVKKNPRSVESLVNAGAAHNRLGRHETARVHLKRATELAPGLTAPWLNLGAAYRGLKRFADAEKAWQRVLVLDEDLADAWYNIGVLHLESEIAGRKRDDQFQDAIEAFNSYKRSLDPREDATEVDQYIREARLQLEQIAKQRVEELKELKEEKRYEEEEAKRRAEEAAKNPPPDDDPSPGDSSPDDSSPDDSSPEDDSEQEDPAGDSGPADPDDEPLEDPTDAPPAQDPPTPSTDPEPEPTDAPPPEPEPTDTPSEPEPSDDPTPQPEPADTPPPVDPSPDPIKPSSPPPAAPVAPTPDDEDTDEGDEKESEDTDDEGDESGDDDDEGWEDEEGENDDRS